MTCGVDVVAAIDCGTNSTRLLISGHSGEDLVRETRITRLGQDVDRSGVLHPDAVSRTLDVLRSYHRTIERFGAARGRMVATSAVRDAANGAEFLAAATDAVGFKAELLSGEEEGRLAFAGATVGLEPSESDQVVVDIGGGSTELIVYKGGTLCAVSLDVGCVRLTERHFSDDPPSEAQIEEATRTIREHLRDAFESLPTLARLEPDSRLIGLAGTVATLAILILGLPGYVRERVHRAVLPFNEVARWTRVLLAESSVSRSRRPGILSGREDIIAAGALTLREVMRMLQLKACISSETDILDGLVASLFGECDG